ncbi:hypothetical protein HZS_8046 [Henneguya salminicola]|nr:hypothetical protein HZS_8046 [Henneguya salminicola]
MSDSNESIMYSSQEETTATVQNTEYMDNRERKQRIFFDQRLFDTIQRRVSMNENKDRKLKDNKGLINTIKDVITIDDSYTQKKNLQSYEASRHNSKTPKKETINYSFSRSRYASLFLSKPDRTFLFLDESGFNLHTSINYGYLDKNVDAVSFVSPNRGRNVSTCCLQD